MQEHESLVNAKSSVKINLAVIILFTFSVGVPAISCQTVSEFLVTRCFGVIFFTSTYMLNQKAENQ